MKTVKIFKIPIKDISKEKLLDICLKKIKARQKIFIITLNAIMVLSYLFRKKFRLAVKKSSMIIPDGYGIIYAGKHLGTPLKHHIPGIDFIYDLLGMAHENKLSVFIVGSKWETIEKAYKVLVKWYPEIRFLGKYSGYFNSGEEQNLLTGIKKVDPDILLVGMGSPKQEIWINKNLNKISAKIIVGLGGSFDIISGRKKRAPENWRSKHLEWLYRSLTSPAKIINLLYIFFYCIILVYYKCLYSLRPGKRLN